MTAGQRKDAFFMKSPVYRFPFLIAVTSCAVFSETTVMRILMTRSTLDRAELVTYELSGRRRRFDDLGFMAFFTQKIRMCSG